MFDSTRLFLFLSAAVLLAIAPGPGMLYVLARSLAGGKRDGILSALGRFAGGMVHVLAAGLEEVYVVPFDRNQVLKTQPLQEVAIPTKWQVSAKGGSYPRWRRDGQELYYVGPGNEFVAARIQAKALTRRGLLRVCTLSGDFAPVTMSR